MSELIEYARQSVKGGLELSVGMAISTAISALGTIIITRLLSPDEYGLYTVAMVPAMMIGLFRDWGVNSAVVRYVPYYRARGEEDRVKAVLKAGLTFAVFTGLLFAFFTLGISNFVSDIVLKKPSVAPLIRISAIWVFSMALFNLSWSALIGFERMRLNGIVLVLQSVMRCIISPLLVLLGYGALGAMIGYSISRLFAALLLVILVMRIYGQIKADMQYSTKDVLALLLSYGFPLAIGGIVAGFGNQFYRFLMSRSCAPEVIGNFGAASNFLVLINLITSPINMALLPTFSKIDGEMENNKLKTAFRSSVKYSSLFVIPLIVGIMVLSRPLVFSLFGQKYSEAPAYLSFLGIIPLFSGVGAINASTLLASQGNTKEIMDANLASLLVGIPISLFLIPRFEIYGLIAILIIVTAIRVFLLDYKIYRMYGFLVDLNSFGRIFLASLAMGACVKTVEYLLAISSPLMQLLICGLIGVLAYVFFILLFGGITDEDILNLKDVLSKSGVLGGVLIRFIGWMEAAKRGMRG